MAGVPYTFGTATANIPLLELDACFATNVTIGTSQVGLGNATANIVGLTNVGAANGVFSTGITVGNLTNQMGTYEVGLWTPVDASGAGLVFVNPLGRYMKIGPFVFFSGIFTYPGTADGSNATIGGLPYTASNAIANSFDGAQFNYTTAVRTDMLQVLRNSTTMYIYGTSGNHATNALYSGASIGFNGFYQASS